MIAFTLQQFAGRLLPRILLSKQNIRGKYWHIFFRGLAILTSLIAIIGGLILLTYGLFTLSLGGWFFVIGGLTALGFGVADILFFVLKLLDQNKKWGLFKKIGIGLELCDVSLTANVAMLEPFKFFLKTLPSLIWTVLTSLWPGLIVIGLGFIAVSALTPWAWAFVGIGAGIAILGIVVPVLGRLYNYFYTHRRGFFDDARDFCYQDLPKFVHRFLFKYWTGLLPIGLMLLAIGFLAGAGAVGLTLLAPLSWVFFVIGGVFTFGGVAPLWIFWGGLHGLAWMKDDSIEAKPWWKRALIRAVRMLHLLNAFIAECGIAGLMPIGIGLLAVGMLVLTSAYALALPIGLGLIGLGAVSTLSFTYFYAYPWLRSAIQYCLDFLKFDIAFFKKPVVDIVEDGWDAIPILMFAFGMPSPGMMVVGLSMITVAIGAGVLSIAGVLGFSFLALVGGLVLAGSGVVLTIIGGLSFIFTSLELNKQHTKFKEQGHRDLVKILVPKPDTKIMPMPFAEASMQIAKGKVPSFPEIDAFQNFVKNH